MLYSLNPQTVTPAGSAISPAPSNKKISRKESHVENIHPVNPDIKIHSVVSSELDFDHEFAMTIPLGETSDEQLLAEVARRHIDLHDKITDSLVKETYEIGKVLGHGASGKVYQVTHKVTGQSFACKVVKKNSSMNDAQSMSTEIEIMKRIRHRNVVSMYELYETPKCLWIILELVDGGDLHHYLAHTPHYNEVMASKQFKQILAGCHYLHSLGVVHRDLKLDNILLHVSTIYDILYYLYIVILYVVYHIFRYITFLTIHIYILLYTGKWCKRRYEASRLWSIRSSAPG